MNANEKHKTQKETHRVSIGETNNLKSRQQVQHTHHETPNELRVVSEDALALEHKTEFSNVVHIFVQAARWEWFRQLVRKTCALLYCHGRVITKGRAK